MTFKLQSHVKPPTNQRRSWNVPNHSEQQAFDAFIKAYRQVHNCVLRLGFFDPESRIQVFEGPTFTYAHSAKRCRERVRQLNFRKA